MGHGTNQKGNIKSIHFVNRRCGYQGVYKQYAVGWLTSPYSHACFSVQRGQWDWFLLSVVPEQFDCHL